MGADGEASRSSSDDLAAAYATALKQRPAVVAPEDWEDACGEAFLRIVVTLLHGAAPTIEDLLAYLMRVARNCMGRARGANVEVQAEVDLAEYEDQRASGDDELLQRPGPWQALLEGSTRWSKRQAELLTLLHAGGCMKPSSLAAAMSCSRQRVLQILDGIAKKARSPSAGEKKIARPTRRRKSRD